MRLSIRAATADDAPAITEVHAAGWRAGYASVFDAELITRAIEERRTRWTDLVASPDFLESLLTVAEMQGAVVAFSHAGRSKDSDDLEIYSFYVHPDHWGTGVAQELMTNQLDLARTLHVKRVRLSAYVDSHRARRFYSRAGFRETGETTRSHFPDGTLIVDVHYEHDLT
jgi:RimJ/RimL family protein N-acetyltransferase